MIVVKTEIKGSVGVAEPVEYLRLAGLRPRTDGQRLGRRRVFPEGVGAETRRYLLHHHAQLGARCLPPRSPAFSR